MVAWILPQTEKTRKAHRQTREMPCIEWSKARHFGEKINVKLRRYVVELFAAWGYQACAPVMIPQWGGAVSVNFGLASNWSERHAACICGFGTFGVSDGLITPAGKAVRVGSVVVRKRYAPTPGLYDDHNEWCLFHAAGKCLACMRRCPVGAISENGHDKVKCKTYIREVTSKYVEQEQPGVRVNSCGLCQTKVPCEARNRAAAKTGLEKDK